MKKILLSLIVLMCFSTVFAQKNYETLFTQTSSNVYQIDFNINNWHIDELTVDDVTYQTLDIDVSTVSDKQGWAELPFISASIQLPAQKDVDYEIIYSDYTDYELDYPMLPSRGTIYRNQDPSQIPYEISPESLVDEFYPSNIIKLEEPFIFRDIRGITVRVSPFQYNAVSNTLRVYYSVQVQLVENDKEPTNPILTENTNSIKEVEGMFQSIFLNYSAAKPSASLTMNEYGDILVITTSAFEATMEPYILWKKEKGYNVSMTIVANGTNVATTIQNAYNANPNLMFVQLAGEWANIKAPTISVTTSADPIDPHMGCVSGSDDYQDISVGRFSCINTSDLTVQINKSIDYEKSPNMTAGWRETFIGIASDEGSGSGDDGEIDYTHVQRIYNDRMNGFTYNTHMQNYDPGASASTLASHVNAGASTIAYCGHGLEHSFYTTGYDDADINSSTNGDKLPFIVSVACVNGSFHTETSCFAETWLRKSNGGAVVTWMATINQPWTPPQRGQDYFYDILSGGFNYDTDGVSATTGYNTSEQRTHWGSIVVNSCNLMLTESSTDSDLETVQTWTTFGDASLQLRTETPNNLTLSNSNPVVGADFSGIANIDGSPAENVLICISQNDVYYHTLTNASGAYSIAQDFTPGNVLLVATAFNSTTVYETVMCVGDPCEPITNLSGSATGTTINLSWDIPTSGTVSGYNIYLDGTFLLNQANTTYSLGSVANGTYEYCINAIFDGDECYAAECVTIIVNDGSSSDCESPTSVIIDEVDATTHTITWTTPAGANNIFDDVESHTAFSINSGGDVPWSYIDGNGTTTYGISDYIFTNSGLAMAYIVFDPNLVVHDTDGTPLTETTAGDPFTAHSGDQFFASFNSSTSANNDWIISPELNFSEDFTFSFFARSGHKTAWAESFEVKYSTTGNTEANFTNTLASIGSAPFSWTEYSYTVPSNATYVSIRCISDDMYYFCVDDIYIGDGSMPTAQLVEYNIYCDGELVGTTDNTTITNTDATGGVHTYCVEAVYDNACISPQACETIGSGVTTYTIEASAGAGGSISPNGTTVINENSQQIYTITPSSCYEIEDVIVDGTSVGNVASYSFTNVTADHIISATFALLSYNITASAGTGGSISPVGSTAVNCGSNQTYTITPEINYTILEVIVNGTNIGAIANYEFTNLNSDATIIANFEEMVGMNSSTTSSDISIFPNPAFDFITMKINNSNIDLINIISIDGKLIQTVEVNSNELNIDMTNWANGIYFIQVNANSETIETIKLIKM